MAIWTFDFYIIPKAKYSKANVKNADFDEVISWNGFSVDDKQLNRLASHFPVEKSWNDDIIQFGEPDSTHIQLFTENNNVLEIFCSLDLRNIKISEIKIVVEFMQNINSVMFFESQAYEVSIHNLIDIIKQSKAFAFCKNPRDYIKQLDK